MASPQTSPVRAIRLTTTTDAGVAIPVEGDSAAVLKAKYTKFVGNVKIRGEPDSVRLLREELNARESPPLSPMPGQGGTRRRRRRSYRRRR